VPGGGSQALKFLAQRRQEKILTCLFRRNIYFAGFAGFAALRVPWLLAEVA